MKINRIIFALCLIFAAGCENKSEKMKADQLVVPVAAKREHILESHGDIRVDPYFWMRERENPEVLDYLERENTYYKEMTSHLDDFKESLFNEMRSRIKEDDSSVPYKYNGYWYITRYREGEDYPVYARKKGSLDAEEEEILFDCQEMAQEYSYFDLRGINVSPDNTRVAFGLDTVGRRQYVIRVKDLTTGEILPLEIDHTTGSSTWAADNETLFYTRKDEETLRSDRIFKHRWGSDPSEDVVVYHEEDETFNAYVYKSKSQEYIVFGSESTLTSEYSVIKADRPHDIPKIIQPRIRGVEYGIYHYENHFYILTNKDDAQNFKLMRCPVDKTETSFWEEVIPHREDVLLEDVDIFTDYLVVSERENGLNQIRIMRWDGTEDYYLPFESETYTAFTSTNLDFDTEVVRLVYNSLTTPSSTLEFNMRTRKTEVLKEQEVLGGKFSKSNYVSERLWATAADGTRIPISLVYRKGLERNGKNPLLLYGYGSYGSTVDPYFSSLRLSLLDRGFVYAIAHVRGGEYLGRGWYEQGKLLHKKNTFTDFIDCSTFLIDQKYTSPEHLYAMGGSAGGLLMGAVMNMAPQLYNGIVAQVPFVDVVTTMLDESIPLTTGEYDEWGNPNDKTYYDYMKSYSPYDNVSKQAYPHIFVSTGFHDSQVQYWEPAKWVAKLRESNSGHKTILFYINMEAGHGGASGRFETLREVAMEYAFLLDLEGIRQ